MGRGWGGDTGNSGEWFRARRSRKQDYISPIQNNGLFCILKLILAAFTDGMEIAIEFWYKEVNFLGVILNRNAETEVVAERKKVIRPSSVTA